MGVDSLKIEKLIFLLFSLATLNGCIESTALLGPAISVGTSGNVYQASLSYASNTLIYNATGKTTIEHVATFLDPTDEFEGDLKPILMNNIKNTKEVLKKPLLTNNIKNTKEVLKKPLKNLTSKEKQKSEPILDLISEDQFILF